MELLALEMMAEHPESLLPYREGQCICVPADISAHRKVGLQDAEVSKSIQEKFQSFVLDILKFFIK